MEINYKHWIAGIRNEIQEISIPQLTDVSTVRPVIIDVREPEEFAQGAIPDAHLIPRGQLEGAIGEHVTDSETPIVLYCAVGERSALAAQSLSRLKVSRDGSEPAGPGSFPPCCLRINAPGTAAICCFLRLAKKVSVA
jgi:rhodanese-related sulfurtransferase